MAHTLFVKFPLNEMHVLSIITQIRILGQNGREFIDEIIPAYGVRMTCIRDFSVNDPG
jgi:hypothetical protein